MPAPNAQSKKPVSDYEILCQSWFKSVGPRTYAAQLKKAGNGNHFLVLTEGRRDEKTGEVKKTRLYLFSEDFAAFFKMLHDTALFIREHPVPDAVRKRQERRWAKGPEKDAARKGAAREGSRSRRQGFEASRTRTAKPV